MKKYLVLRDSHGFQGRYWHKDAIVEFDDDVQPHPKNFQLLDGGPAAKKAQAVVVDEKQTLSQLAIKAIKPQLTAGQVLRHQKKSGIYPKAEDF